MPYMNDFYPSRHIRAVFRVVVWASATSALLFSGCGGGGGGSSNSDQCIAYAEDLCARLVDCADRPDREDQCFAELVAFISNRGDSLSECAQQNEAVSTLTCGQLFALANVSRTGRSDTHSDLEVLVSHAIDLMN